MKKICIRYSVVGTVWIAVRLSKCKFFQEQVEFLGHSISREDIQPTKERVEGILSAAESNNKKELSHSWG